MDIEMDVDLLFETATGGNGGVGTESLSDSFVWCDRHDRLATLSNDDDF